MRKTMEIPREEWKDYLKRFSREHFRGTVVVEVLDPESGPGTEARNLPLGEVVADIHRGENSIDVLLGEGPDLTHTISDPVRLYVLEDDDGGSGTMEIESETGVKTLIHFRPQTFPAEA